jgi:uncharacterized protein YjbJ (UPF0337 family)
LSSAALIVLPLFFNSVQIEKEFTMNQDQVKGKFEQLKGEIKKRWGQITDDDITEARGDVQKLMGKIREKSGDKQQDIERWFSAHHDV